MTIEELKEIIKDVSDHYEVDVLGVKVDASCFKAVDSEVVFRIFPPSAALAQKLGKKDRCEHAEDCCHFSEADDV